MKKRIDTSWRYRNLLLKKKKKARGRMIYEEENRYVLALSEFII